MNISSVRVFMAVLGLMVSSFFSRMLGRISELYPNPFAQGVVRMKAVVALAVSLLIAGWLVATGVYLGAAVIAIMGPVAGMAVLTGAHLVYNVVAEAFKDSWSLVKAFAQSFNMKKEAA